MAKRAAAVAAAGAQSKIKKAPEPENCGKNRWLTFPNFVNG